MKKTFLILLLTLMVHEYVQSQSIKGNLECPFFLETNGGACLFGIDKSNKFLATLYDSKLNVKKTYTRQLREGEKNAEVTRVGEFFLVKLSSGLGREGSLIKLDLNITEISYEQFTKEDTKLFYDDVKKGDKNNHVKYTFPESIAGKDGSMYFGSDLFEVKHKVYLNTPVLAVSNAGSYSHQGPPVIRRYAVSSVNLWQRYKAVWETKLEFEKISLYEFIYIDSKKAYVQIKVYDGKLGLDYILCLDSNSGEIIFSKQLKYAETGADIRYTSAFYDALKDRLIVVGDCYDSMEKLRKIRMKGVAIFALGSKGEQISQEIAPYPTLNVNEPQGYDFSDIASSCHKIIQSTEGFVIILSLSAKEYISGPTSNDHIFGYSSQTKMIATEGIAYQRIGFNKLIVDNNLKLKKSDHFIFNEIKDFRNVSFFSASTKGETVIFGNLDFNQSTLVPEFVKVYKLVFEKKHEETLFEIGSVQTDKTEIKLTNTCGFQADQKSNIVFIHNGMMNSKSEYELRVVQVD